MEFFQALARAEVQRLRTQPELLGEFRGNKHAAHGVANHFSLVRRGGGGRLRPANRSPNVYPGRTEYRPQASGHRSEKERQDDEFQNVEEKTSHNESDDLSLRRDA